MSGFQSVKKVMDRAVVGALVAAPVAGFVYVKLGIDKAIREEQALKKRRMEVQPDWGFKDEHRAFNSDPSSPPVRLSTGGQKTGDGAPALPRTGQRQCSAGKD